MIQPALIVLACCVLLGSCSAADEKALKYPRKPDDTTGRKAGAAMLLYEQAEKDMDVNENVIVIPPVEKPSATTTTQ